MKIGEVYMMKFEGTGSEQNKWRPGVVFQNSVGNAHSPNVIALPLTTSLKKLSQPTHVLVYAENSGLRYDSIVLCENPVTMSKDKIGKYLTTLPEEYMRKVAVANLIATAAISFLSIEDLCNAWKQTIALEAAAA